MKFLILGVALFLLVSPAPVVFAQSGNAPPWFFQGAYLNYTNVFMQNSSIEKIVNVSYRILSIRGDTFTYEVIPGQLSESNYTVEASLDHLNGFPALNSTQISLLNSGNTSFLKIIKLPFTQVNVSVKTNVISYTSQGIVSSDFVVVRITSKFSREIKEEMYTNYSTYSGIILNMKINFGNTTAYVSNLVSTNVPLGTLTWPQIVAEAFGFILIAVIAIYLIRRYRKTGVR